MTAHDRAIAAGDGFADILLRKVARWREQPDLLLHDVLVSLFSLSEGNPGRVDRGRVTWMLDRALNELETDGPRVSMDNMRADAALWSETCSPRELEVYFLATMKRLQADDPLYAANARKRLLVQLWAGLGDADRAAFLGKTDPDGRFRRS